MTQTLKRLFLFLICGLVLSCGRPDVQNDCVIDAIEYKHAIYTRDRLIGAESWARIIFYQYGNKAHAIVVYRYRNMYFVWDETVGSKVFNYKSDMSALDIVRATLMPWAISARFVDEP